MAIHFFGTSYGGSSIDFLPFI